MYYLYESIMKGRLQIMIDKTVNKQYTNMIELCKKLKPHATNLMVQKNYVLMMPIVTWVRNFCVLTDDTIDVESCRRYHHLLYDLSQSSEIHKHFKVTKTDLDWIKENDDVYLQLTFNSDELEDNVRKIPLMTNENAISELEHSTYGKILSYENCKTMEELINKLNHESDSNYHDFPEHDIERIKKKLICVEDVIADSGIGYRIIVSRPFLGELKNTEWVKYKVIQEPTTTNQMFIVRFIQKEPFGYIYTYAAFLYI